MLNMAIGSSVPYMDQQGREKFFSNIQDEFLTQEQIKEKQDSNWNFLRARTKKKNQIKKAKKVVKK